MENRKTAFVTGANKGIGLATVKLLTKREYPVWMGVRDMDRGEAAYQQLKRLNLNVQLVEIDVSDDASVELAANYLKEHVKKLDILVNNGGVAEDLSK